MHTSLKRRCVNKKVWKVWFQRSCGFPMHRLAVWPIKPYWRCLDKILALPDCVSLCHRVYSLYTFLGWSAVFALVSRFPGELPQIKLLRHFYRWFYTSWTVLWFSSFLKHVMDNWSIYFHTLKRHQSWKQQRHGVELGKQKDMSSLCIWCVSSSIWAHLLWKISLCHISMLRKFGGMQ